MTEEARPDNKQAQNRKLTLRLCLVSVGFFGFAFALIPLYSVFCDITGLNGKIDLSAGARQVDTSLQADSSRLVTVEFVADVDPGLAWELKPEVSRIKVHPGEKTRVAFYAKNLSGKDIVARAVPSLTPGHGALHFKKIECFCFNEMFLAAGDGEEMPLVFYLDGEFPQDINTITLAYKAYDITDQVKVVEARSDSDKQDLIN